MRVITTEFKNKPAVIGDVIGEINQRQLKLSNIYTKEELIKSLLKEDNISDAELYMYEALLNIYKSEKAKMFETFTSDLGREFYTEIKLNFNNNTGKIEHTAERKKIV